jgi:hypothetical protein
VFGVLVKINRDAGESSGGAFASIVRNMKSTIGLSSHGVTVEKIRKTRSGDLLLELGKGQPVPDKFREDVALAVAGLGEVTHLQDTAKVHISGIDATATEEEVKADMKVACDGRVINFGKMRWAAGGQQSIDATLIRSTVDKLIAEGKIRIGWSRCRVRLKERSNRCFRCQGFGHLAKECKGPDRSGICMRCGSEGHIARRCQAQPCCPLCKADGRTELGHMSGGDLCNARRINTQIVKI